MINCCKKETQTFKHKYWQLERLPEAICSYLLLKEKHGTQPDRLWTKLSPSLLGHHPNPTMRYDGVLASGGCVEGTCPSSKHGLCITSLLLTAWGHWAWWPKNPQREDDRATTWKGPESLNHPLGKSCLPIRNSQLRLYISKNNSLL